MIHGFGHGIPTLAAIKSEHKRRTVGYEWKENNYSETDIKSLDVKHSFVNILLSYNEWIIDVVFEDEPESIYKYTLRNGKIVQSGVSGTTDVKDLKH